MTQAAGESEIPAGVCHQSDFKVINSCLFLLPRPGVPSHRAVGQEVSGRLASKASPAAPHRSHYCLNYPHSPAPIRGKTVFHETGPWCQKVGDRWPRPSSFFVLPIYALWVCFYKPWEKSEFRRFQDKRSNQVSGWGQVSLTLVTGARRGRNTPDREWQDPNSLNKE